jgi:hypothetical protein
MTGRHSGRREVAGEVDASLYAASELSGLPCMPWPRDLDYFHIGHAPWTVLGAAMEELVRPKPSWVSMDQVLPPAQRDTAMASRATA